MADTLPESFKKLVVTKPSTDFRSAVSVVTEKSPSLGDNEILVKNCYVGINATDINASAGKYFGGKPPPFDIGFEGIGTVVAVGSKVASIKVKDSVIYMNMSAYAEYSVVPETSAFVVDAIKPEYLGLMVCGLTASIALDKSARIMEGETVFVTAAAGGTGHIVIQWAKAAGCHVIGTCSSEKKSKILKDLGCDRIINYKTEDIDSVLSKEYPRGIDVVWETIGGKMFEILSRHLAIKGRLIIIGAITSYKDASLATAVDLSPLPMMLLTKAAAIQGFFLPLFQECFGTYFAYLKDRTVKKELRVIVDDGQESTGQQFVGLEGVIKAVEHLHSGSSMGKVIARIN